MIVEFQDTFIENLQNRYQFKNQTQVLDNKRYYMTTLEIENHSFILCVPLHSKGRNHFVAIDPPHSSQNSSHWQAHGLNFEKMLIATEQEIRTYGSKFKVANNVWEDIKTKKKLIQNKATKYLVEYLHLLKKDRLSRKEENTLKHSALNSFPNEIEILANSNSEIRVKFVDLEYLFNN